MQIAELGRVDHTKYTMELMQCLQYKIGDNAASIKQR